MPHTLTQYGVKVFEITEEEYLNLGELVDNLLAEVSREGVFIARLTTWKEDDAKTNVAQLKAFIGKDEGHKIFHPEWLKSKSLVYRKVFRINPLHDQTVDVQERNKLRRAQSSMKKRIRDFDFFAGEESATELEKALHDGGVGDALDFMVDTLEGQHNNILYLTNMSLDEPFKTTQTASLCNSKTNLQSLASGPLAGITVPTVYVGSPFSTFSCHREDCAFFAVNRHIAGGTKMWFCVPPRFYSAFQRLLTMLPLQDEFRQRSCYMQHKELWLDPRLLIKAGIPVYTIEQRPGDIVILLPNTIHFGFNVNVNTNEAVNFVSKSWVLPGMTALQRCECKSEWAATFVLQQVFKDLSTSADLVQEWKTGLQINLNRMLKEQTPLMYPHLRDMGDEPVTWLSLLGSKADPSPQLQEEHHSEDAIDDASGEEPGLNIDSKKSPTWATCTRCTYCPHRYMGDAPQRIYAHAVRCHGEQVAKEILKEVMDKYGTRPCKTKGHDCEKCGKNIKGNSTNMRSHQNSTNCKRPQDEDDDDATASKKRCSQ